MTFNLFRCGVGYVLTAEGVTKPVADPALGPFEFIGQFPDAGLRDEVRKRVLSEVDQRDYAVISKDELGLP